MCVCVTHKHTLQLGRGRERSAPTAAASPATLLPAAGAFCHFQSLLSFLITLPKRNIRNNWIWQSWLIRKALIRTFFFFSSCYFAFENPHAAHSSRQLGDPPATFLAQTFREGLTNQSAVWPTLLCSCRALGLQLSGEMKAHQSLGRGNAGR